ncbi:MAG: hypothetical protein KCHDKBKB_00020 [Elusimicrobia bacterium]|nr:hypothetical protein [Elusimicrobiota bacterium]
MRFANPEFFWLLLLLPLLAAYLAFFRENDIPSFQFSALHEETGLSKGEALKPYVFFPGILRLLAFLLIIIALARPQKGLRSEETTAKATDIMICLDASRSMLAVDFKPENRFQVAKNVIADFIKAREQDRIGLVLFAEHAITQCPLTTDKTALLSILDSIQVGSISPDRTAVGIGIATSVNRLKNSQAKSKVMILVTDGANNAGNIDPLTAAKSAAAYGIKIHAIGAGSPEDTFIPIDDPTFGKRMVPMRSDLNEDELLKITVESGGKYFRAKTSGALKTIFNEIDAMEKTDIKIKEYVDYKELYWPLLLGALFFLFCEFTLIKTKYRTLP